MYGMATGPVDQTTVKEPAIMVEEEAETLLTKTPLSCEPPRKIQRCDADYVDASTSSKLSNRGRPIGGYSDADIVTMLQSLQSEVDMMKNSIYASIKDKDSCLYENIDLARKNKRSESEPSSTYMVTAARERGFHRLAYIVDSNSHFCRRFIWMLLLLGSLGLLAYQLMDRVVLYQTFPSHISLEARYPERLAFPSVTICNLNQFRLTKTVENGVYRLLHNLQHQKELHRDSYMYSGITSLNKNYSVFLKESAHQREDLINSCRWQGESCDWTNFSPVITDFGLCYLFRPPEGRRSVKRQGAYKGLTLVLNVEQYEYLLGPKSAVGVKIAIHDPDEIPSMQRFGINVPVGRHTAIGIKKVKHESLPRPHGSCRPDKPYRRHIPSNSCFYNCRCRAVMANCNCSMPFTYSRQLGLNACKLRDYVSCVVKPFDPRLDNCSSECSMRCSRNEYDPVVSEAAMSTYGAESKVLQLRHKAPLEDKLRKAMDMYHREDDVIYEYDKDMLDKLSQRLNSRGTNTSILSGYLQSYDRKDESSLKRLKVAFKKLNDSVRIHYTLFKQSSHTTFTLYVNHMDNILNTILSLESSLQPGESIMSVNETLNSIVWKLDQLIDVNPRRLHTSEPMFSEITESVKAFQKDLLEEYGQSYEEFRAKKGFYQRRTSRILNITGSMKRILIRQYYLIRNTTLKLNLHETRIRDNIDAFFRDIKSMLENEMKTFNDELSELSNSYVNDRAEILDFFKNLRDISGNFSKGLDGVKQDLASLKTLSLDLRNRLSTVRSELAKLSTDYLERVHNKSDLAQKFQNTGIGTAISAVQTSLQDILNAVNHLSSEGTQLANSVKPIADRIIAFGLMVRNDVDLDLQWLTFNALMDKVRLFIKDIRDNLQAISLYRGELKEYIKRTKVDEIFYRNNFLHMDIYFKDLSETVISQRPSYTLLDLICDVGGSMALYLGASILTILEISDFMCKCCDVYCGKKR